MDGREEATGRQQLGGDDAITTKIGAVTLPLAVIVLVTHGRSPPSSFAENASNTYYKSLPRAHGWPNMCFGHLS